MSNKSGDDKSSAQNAQAVGRSVDLNSLTAQQLMQVKKQLDDELENLNSSYTQLHSAQVRFVECGRCVDQGVAKREVGASLLVPLTQSLYVPGKLSSNTTVLLDIGTGFYVEKVCVCLTRCAVICTKPVRPKSVEDAQKFYTAKSEDIGTNLKDLEGILQSKSSSLRVVEEGNI